MLDKELCAGDPAVANLPQVDDGNTVGRAGHIHRSFSPADSRDMVSGVDQPVDCHRRIQVGAELPEKPACSLVTAVAAAPRQCFRLLDFNIRR